MAEDATMQDNDVGLLIPGTSSTGLEYSLHPLLLLNISDHCMRMRAVKDNTLPTVIGCLLGQQSGRCVDISNSFEMLSTEGGTDYHRDVFDNKKQQYAECYKTLNVVGWYATGSSLQAWHLQLHKKFHEHTEAPVFLLMDVDAAGSPDTKELPMQLYETGVHLVNNVPQTLFVQTGYSMAASDAERIGVDAAQTGASAASGEHAALEQHYGSLSSALKMLSDCLERVHAHMANMQQGSVAVNHQVLRMVAGLLDRLPTDGSSAFQTALTDQCTDATVLNMLSMVTKGIDTAHQLGEAVSMTYTKRQ